MSLISDESPHAEIVVTLRYWAGAKARAGVAEDRLAFDTPPSVADVVAAAVAERASLAEVVAACSVLVDEAPLGARDPAQVRVVSGAVIDLLPPFAGG